MARLAGKVAVVTGAGRGIGKAIALRLASDGAAVVVNYARNASAAQAVVDDIAAGGGSAIAVQADISDLAEVSHLVNAASATFRKVDILVHNAGMRGNHPLIAAYEPEMFDRFFALHVRGPVFLTQQIVPLMPDNGRIIAISSASTARKLPGLGFYTGSKAALEAFIRCWAGELASRGITANTISPGAVETELFAEGTGEFNDKLLPLIPMGRFGQPADIADVCGFLASDDARWLTGLNIAATGGA